MFQRALVQVSGENFNHPAFEQAVRLVQQRHAQGVRFFSGRAARAPDTEAALQAVRLSRKNIWNHDAAQSIELRCVAEEARFSDRDFIEQGDEFPLPNRADREVLEVLAQGSHAEVFHTPAAALAQQTEFVVRMKNSTHLINQFADAHEFRFGWLRRDRGRLHRRRGGHGCLSDRSYTGDLRNAAAALLQLVSTMNTRPTETSSARDEDSFKG